MTPARPETAALVIHCSDYRFVAASAEFLRASLALPDYDLIAVPGGALALAPSPQLPKMQWALARWTGFLAHAHSLHRAVLIAHEDCRWYLNVYGPAADVPRLQREDLVAARLRLLEMYPHMKVEAFYAHRPPAGAGCRFESVR